MEIDYTDNTSLYRMVAVVGEGTEAEAIAFAQDFIGTSENPAQYDVNGDTHYVTFERDD